MVDSTDLEENIDVDTLQHEAEGSLRDGWPAILLTIVMISAAVYAFSPRPHPPFPATQVKPGQLMTNGLAVQGSRYIAVGELGRILVADDANGPWHEAKIEKQRGANLTKVKFIAKNTALAVGHSGWLLRSDDGGENWYELAFNDKSSDPLLNIGGPFTGKAAGRLFAFGAFGQYMVSRDGGKSWMKQTLTMAETEDEEAPVEESTETIVDEFSADYDPFAEFESGGMTADYSSRHFYDMEQVSDGSLILVGERGMVLRSTNGGASWLAGEEIYTGSFYGVMAVPNDGVLVFGMRGNAFLTHDFGKTWTQSEIPLVQGLYAGAVAEDGTTILVGASNTILVSRDGGASFKKASQRGPFSLATILSLGDNAWLMAGEGGIGSRSVLKAAGDKS